jgi:broad specificity phosphatase PhoE
MQAPGITRGRRPFLAPIWLTFAGVLAIALVAFGIYRSATTTTVVIVRHAEKQLGTIEDPPLTSEGEARADRLASLLGNADGFGAIQGIYVSDTRRSLQTAAPLAARLRLRPEIVPATDVQELVSRVRQEHRGSRALIVGHSNTVPEIIERLADIEVPPMQDEEYGSLYVVTVPTFGPSSVLRITY